MISMRAIGFFFLVFHRFSVRHIARHPGRALAVVAGIALGAAVFTSVRLSVYASLRSFEQSMENISGNADRVVSRPGGGTPEDLVASLSKLAFVKSASPVSTAYVRPRTRDAEPLLLIGIDPVMDRPVRSSDFDSPGWSGQAEMWMDLIRKPATMVAGRALLDDLGLGVGDRAVLEHVGRESEFVVLGTLSDSGFGLVEGGKAAVCDIATFQEFTGKFGQVDRIDLLFDASVSKEELEQVEKLLPEGVFMGFPGEDRRSGREMIDAYRLNLSVLSFVSLFVGMFLVYSLVALNAASRRKEIAILRSMGASAGLIFGVFLSEGVLFGLAGWAAALPVGAVMTKFLLKGVGETISTLFVRVSVARLHLSAWEVALSFAATVFVALLAALHPAREAMKVPPKEAMEIGRPAVRYRRISKKLGLAGLVLVLSVWPLSKAPPPDGVPLPGYLAVFVLFAGFSMLSPWVLSKVGQWAAPGLRRIGKEPAYLAAMNIRDSGARTAISAGALITAAALFCALVIMVHSFRQSVELWVDNTVVGDIFLRAEMADANRYRDPIDEKAVRFLQKLDGPFEMDVYRRFYLTRDDSLYQFEPLTWDVYLKYGRFFWLDGDPASGVERLRRGEGLVVSEVFANRTGLGAGDVFEASILGARFEIPVVGVIRDYRTRGGVVYYSLEHFREKTGDTDWGGVRIFFKDRGGGLAESISELKSRIVACCGDSIQVTEGTRLREAILEIFDETFAITTVLLVIALAVAALGIASTLTVTVLERSRELNTLFATGGSYGQIRAMIFWEAILLVLAGEVSGLLCGFALSYLLVFVINKQSFGWTFVYGVDVATLVLSVPLIVSTALAAALPAVKTAFRQPPAALLRER